ncbi:MAG: type I methionyl aminopeptidase [Candidatus Saccharimonadales bacterium]
MYTRVKTEQEIKDLRTSGQILANVFAYLKTKIEVGVTTKQLAVLAAQEITRLGGDSVLLGYSGFPDVICISLNDEVVHGIPGPKVVQEGDLVSFDLCVGYNGMITDAAITVVAGEASGQKRRLLKGTEEALLAGISVVKDGVKTGDIGAAVEKVMTQYGFGIVRDLVGHGVGHQVHEEPDVPNYGVAGTGNKLSKGMTIAIEPMSTLGSERVVLDQDGWTIKTYDKSLSAHFEHTVLILENRAEILTATF